MKKIKVSVVCISYNQERYIRQAIDSFINQETNFDVEIVIADDASTDKTQSIIQSYADKYPEIIIPVLRKKNVGIQENLFDALDRASGEYIALCEGDDYWTDNNKLQMQADSMDGDKKLAISFHSVNVVYEKSEKKDSIFPETPKDYVYNLDNLLKMNFIQTNSVMYRRQTYKELKRNVMPADWYLHLFHAQFGEIVFIDKTASVYRRHEDGVWWETVDNRDEIWKKHGFGHISLFFELLKFYGNKNNYRSIIIENIVVTLRTFARIDASSDTALLRGCFEKFPDQHQYLFEAMLNLIDEDTKIQKNQKEEISLLNDLSQKRLDDLNAITSSKRYALVEKLAGLKSKLKP